MIKITLNTLAAVREAVPQNIRRLTPETLQNLQTALDPVPADLMGIEYWPEVEGTYTFDPITQELGDEILTVNETDKTVVITFDVINKPAEQIAEELAAYRQVAAGTVVDRQYREADKGTVVNGLPVATTIDSIAEITGAVQGNGRNPANVRKINLRGGRVEMDKAQLEGLADAVDNYRQLCHDRGFDICDLIDLAGDKSAIDAVIAANIDTGWPV